MPSAPLPTHPPASAAAIPQYLATFTNYELQRPLEPTRRALGPARARTLLERLALLPPSLPVVQVAGSKGKGSCVLWMEQLLTLRGARPAAYLSPHLERLNERIRIAGRDCDDAALVAGLAEIHPHLQALARAGEATPTFFDLWTTLALVLARSHHCDTLLLEVGLGGPLDSTSAIPHDVGVLTQVELEHRQELGDTVAEIAAEKARIARRGHPLVIGTAELRRQLRRQVESAGALLQEPAAHARLPDALPPGQQANLACAVAALESLPTTQPFSNQELAAAARTIVLPARLEAVPGPPPLLLDGAHTRESVTAFAECFARTLESGAIATLLVAWMAGKEWQAGLEVLHRSLPHVNWLVTQAHPERGLPAVTLGDWLRSRGAPCEEFTRPHDAATRLLELGREGHSVGVTGSFYLAGTVRGMWPRTHGRRPGGGERASPSGAEHLRP